MKILITGTNGFVGRNLKEFFEARYTGSAFPKRQDLNLLDWEAVEGYLDAGQFDAVIHCGVTLHSVEENLKMYFNIERCSKSFGKLICVGSGAEYGPGHYTPKMKEEYFGSYIPKDIYGFSKYVIAKDIEATPRNIFNLRVFGIFGKYEDYKRRFISNNICRVLSGQNISLNRDMGFDFLVVDDFAPMLQAFMSGSPLHRSYNVCRGEGIDLLRLAEIIRDVDGKDVSIEVKADGKNPEYTGDNSRFVDEFGIPEFSSFHSSVEKLYKWYAEDSGIDFTENPLLQE